MKRTRRAVSGIRRNVSMRLACLFLLAALSPASSAAEAGTDEAVMLAERPSMNGEPTEIEVGLYVMDIDEIDDVRQRFSVALSLVGRWQDPRLALPPSERKGLKRFLSPAEVWTPRILFLNDRGLEGHLREGVEVDDLGTVRYQNRLSGELTVNMEFRDFPFDTQILPIDIVSYEYTTDEMRFLPLAKDASRETDFSIEGWEIDRLKPEASVFITPSAGVELPRLTFAFEARRDSEYYTLTMLVPMALIIFMAWTVFWLQPNIVPPRIAISTASIFSLIALGVSIRLGLPKVSYLTRADLFVLGCTLMVFIALGVAVIGSRWASSDRMAQALKANAISRWVYAILFIVVAVTAFHF